MSYKVSQNFLTSSHLIRQLLSLTTIGPDDYVLDIGAGKGHLTKVLAERCGAVCAVEIDPGLSAGLARRFAGVPHIQVYRQDFLRFPLPRCAYKVFSNIPFNRTTDIARRLLLSETPPEAAWLVMEKGAAKRLLGQPRENGLSLPIKAAFDCKIAYRFRRGDFHPMPSVDCVLFSAVRRAAPDIQPRQLGAFGHFVTGAGRYGLQRFLTKKQVSTALRLAGLPAIPASGDMLYVQWLCLFRCHCHFSGR